LPSEGRTEERGARKPRGKKSFLAAFVFRRTHSLSILRGSSASAEGDGKTKKMKKKKSAATEDKKSIAGHSFNPPGNLGIGYI